jgi:hypothetical protein
MGRQVQTELLRPQFKPGLLEIPICLTDIRGQRRGPSPASQEMPRR